MHVLARFWLWQLHGEEGYWEFPMRDIFAFDTGFKIKGLYVSRAFNGHGIEVETSSVRGAEKY